MLARGAHFSHAQRGRKVRRTCPALQQVLTKSCWQAPNQMLGVGFRVTLPCPTDSKAQCCMPGKQCAVWAVHINIFPVMQRDDL